MAAPPEVSIRNLSGQWTLNKTLSDSSDSVLALDDIGWWIRKIAAIASVTLQITQYADKDDVTHIDINQTVTGGIKGTTECRELNWTFQESDHHIFGHLKTKSRWVNPIDITNDWLKEGWSTVDEEIAGPAGELFIQTYVENTTKGSRSDQVWGVSIIDGKRYYVRKLLVHKGDATVKVRFVYNWLGK